ncbi:MAG: hypothetical protein E7412_07650 [Ruminococcaceae bacterium]|nr:hypothetical protein [Oscillospiraceae bacterium]
MKPVVYLDMLFLLNLLMDSVILYLTAVFLHKKLSLLRMLCVSSFGALYSCVMFFPQISFLYSILFKSIFLTLVAYLAFPTKVPLELLKNALVLRVVNFVFGGIMFSIIFTTRFGTVLGSVVSNGEIYLNIKPSALFLSTVFSYIIMYAVSVVKFSKEIESKDIVEVAVIFGNNTLRTKALCDTGCNLTDPISGNPAVVISPDAAKKLFPEQILKELDSGRIPKDYITKYRLLPVSTVENDISTLHGFIPDRLFVDNCEVFHSIIALSKTNLHIQSDITALLNPDILAEYPHYKLTPKQRKAVNTL